MSPLTGTHVCTPGLCGAQLRHTTRSDYNCMDDWGSCHAEERDRWQRAPVRVACLSPEYQRRMEASALGTTPVASNEVYTYGLPPVPRAETQPFRRNANLFNLVVVVQLPCDTGTCYPATLYIVASVRAPCPTCPQPPCL
eukprot:2039217-Prymnesium_polylepis.1